ncbi:hypothetical protein [Streptomyces sp. ISL-94]|uniref:hypothetical protein n=1 Tax=Streptomyces sp. ISL-94 TaxID=2819190 RepID=UPI001BE7B6DE|nr:hypothetical protein [Streptomyces sp. ISL-94]MBT2477626.1 hypothetical protein [Streptomyces sp. ISL-94]
MSSDWYEQRRKDEDAKAARELAAKAAAAQLAREEERKSREEQRAVKLQTRKDKAQRRRDRASKRQRDLAPGSVYRRGTLALVGFSITASLPAQIIHFVSIHWMLFPIGPALEGSAWILAAGVAYADEKRLALWVRWVLRALSMSAASYAALINYQYGQGLVSHGLTAGQTQTAAMGLAAVTLGGPLFFEVRQWVLTLTAAVGNARHRLEKKARARHEKARREEFKEVTDRAKALLLAAPYGALSKEEAFTRAWWDIQGAPPGVTADVIADRLQAEADVAAVLAEAERTPERLAVEFLLADLFGSEVGVPGKPSKGAPQGRTALGGKGNGPVLRSSDEDALKPLAEADLAKVRKLADALGGPDRLSARNVREAVGCRNAYALRLRDAVQSEQQ